MLFGLADPDVSRQVIAAHERAVDESLRYLERWALAHAAAETATSRWTRDEGMIVAAFRHRTSRAGDPQLHTHALMANAVERSDGSWGAIDSRPVYRQARSAGFVYQAVLRSQLTERLGVRWSPSTGGASPSSSTFPSTSGRCFRSDASRSKLRSTPVARRRGAAAQVAALRTRVSKHEVASTDVLRARWRDEAADIGLSGVDDVVGAVGDADVRERVSVRDRRVINSELLGPLGLTEQRTSYQRGHISQAWCQAIDPHTVGVTAASIEELVETTIGDRRNVLLGDDDPANGLDRRRWSTQDLLDVEAHILDLVDRRPTRRPWRRADPRGA